MKKISMKSRRRTVRLNLKRRIRDKRRAEAIRRVGRRRSRYFRKFPERVRNREILKETERRREAIIKDLYGFIKYDQPNKTIAINNEFGLEEDSLANEFLSTASTFVGVRSRKLHFDLSKCVRLWPTAITLLCSLQQWVLLTSTAGNHQLIGNSDSESEDLNAYLEHCGFYEYVGRRKPRQSHEFKDDHIVKIRQEMSRANIRSRTKELIGLVKRYSTFDEEEIEYFVSQVVFEVVLNITEHGIHTKDQGWWMIAQYHPTHGYISICFADNGIGIRNSLKSGPQRDSISFPDHPDYDGQFIKLAMSSVVTGAVDRRYPSGNGRGKGLKKIVQASRELGVKVRLLSHYGYAFMLDPKSDIECGSHKHLVFAGTMHHFIIPARMKEGEHAN